MDIIIMDMATTTDTETGERKATRTGERKTTTAAPAPRYIGLGRGDVTPTRTEATTNPSTGRLSPR
jgi:hypothetical protein